MNHKDLAHKAVNSAIRKGVLKSAKLFNCQICGEQAAHLHHHNGYAPENYLDVIPLCVSCHWKQHAKPEGIPVLVRLTSRMKEMVRAIASKDGCSMSDVVELAIQNYVKEHTPLSKAHSAQVYETSI
jgi:hypothetical protein